MTAFILFALFVSLAALIVFWRESKTLFKPPKDYKEKEQ